jgi:hypothetical protein
MAIFQYKFVAALGENDLGFSVANQGYDGYTWINRLSINPRQKPGGHRPACRFLFKSSLSFLYRGCWGGQSVLCLRYGSWGMFLSTLCSPVKLTSRAP